MASLTITGSVIASNIKSFVGSMADQFRAVSSQVRTGNEALEKQRNLIRQQIAAVNQLKAARMSLDRTVPRFQNRTTETASGYGKQGTPGTYWYIPGAQGTRFGSRPEAEKFVKGMEQISGAMDKYKKKSKDVEESNRRQGVSFTNLLGLMIKFGIAMEIIRIPERIIGGFRSIVEIGTDWEQKLANINSLLQVNKSEITELGRQLSDVAAQHGVTGDLLEAAYEIASTTSQELIDSVQRTLSGQGQLGAEATAVLQMTNVAAKAAIAGVSEIGPAVDVATRIQSIYNTTIQETEGYLNSVFVAIDKGKFRFEDISSNIGLLASQTRFVFGKEGLQGLKDFQAVMAALATITISMDPDRAVISLSNVLRNLGNYSAGAQKVIDIMATYGIKLQVADIAAQGANKSFRELNRAFGTHGVIVGEFVKAHGKFATIQDEENFRLAVQKDLLSQVFANRRTERGIMALLNRDMALYNENIKEQDTNVRALQDAYEKNKDTVQNSMNTLSLYWKVLKNEFFLTIDDDLKRILGNVNNWLRDITQSIDFQEASLSGKFTIIWDEFTDSFDKWYKAGGEQKIETVTGRITELLITGLVTVSADHRVHSAAIETGIVIGRGIGSGIWQGIKDFFKENESAGVFGLVGAVLGTLIAPGPGTVIGAATLSTFGYNMDRIEKERLEDYVKKQKEKDPNFQLPPPQLDFLYNPPKERISMWERYRIQWEQYKHLYKRIESQLTGNPIPAKETDYDYLEKEQSRTNMFQNLVLPTLDLPIKPAPAKKIDDEYNIAREQPSKPNIFQFGDIAVSSKEEAMEEFAKILDYADTPHPQIGHLQYGAET